MRVYIFTIGVLCVSWISLALYKIQMFLSINLLGLYTGTQQIHLGTTERSTLLPQLASTDNYGDWVGNRSPEVTYEGHTHFVSFQISFHLPEEIVQLYLHF